MGSEEADEAIKGRKGHKPLRSLLD